MIITYLRSSSYTEWDFCQNKYYIDYVLGFHSPANKAAQKGTIVHKALELLARRKLAEQQCKSAFISHELERTFDVHEIDPDTAIELAFEYYSSKKEFEYTKADYNDCIHWMWEALLWKNGTFSPLKLKILEAEQYFDFEIQEPWAEYSYKLPDGTLLEGHLGLKGTIDLVTQRDPHTIEVIDWKTGRRINWNTMKQKEYDDFYSDPQLLIYYYAACRLYPNIENVFFTIFYMQSGGPFSLCFDKSHYAIAENMLRTRFNTIRNTKKPNLIWPHKKCSWCFFSKNKLDNSPAYSYHDSICRKIKDEILTLGISKVTQKYSKDKSHSLYKEGGGRKHDS